MSPGTGEVPIRGSYRYFTFQTALRSPREHFLSGEWFSRCFGVGVLPAPPLPHPCGRGRDQRGSRGRPNETFGRLPPGGPATQPRPSYGPPGHQGARFSAALPQGPAFVCGWAYQPIRPVGQPTEDEQRSPQTKTGTSLSDRFPFLLSTFCACTSEQPKNDRHSLDHPRPFFWVVAFCTMPQMLKKVARTTLF